MVVADPDTAISGCFGRIRKRIRILQNDRIRSERQSFFKFSRNIYWPKKLINIFLNYFTFYSERNQVSY